jgi:competence protein ComEA
VTSRRQTETRAGERLQALSRQAYSAAAGHLDVDPEPAGEKPRRRWSIRSRTAAVAVTAVLLLAGAVGLRALWTVNTPAAEPVVSEGGWAPADEALSTPVARPADGSPAQQDEAGGPDDDPSAGRRELGAELVVHVAGKVARPGVLTLPPGSRVHDAVTAAGGATEAADLGGLNLARLLVDGEQVYVPGAGEAPRPAPAGAETGATVVNLNTATVEQLDALPGIGPVLAARIVDWRTEHGRFTAVEELGEVSGIGPAVLGRLRELVTL